MIGIRGHTHEIRFILVPVCTTPTPKRQDYPSRTFSEWVLLCWRDKCFFCHQNPLITSIWFILGCVLFQRALKQTDLGWFFSYGELNLCLGWWRQGMEGLGLLLFMSGREFIWAGVNSYWRGTWILITQVGCTRSISSFIRSTYTEFWCLGFNISLVLRCCLLLLTWSHVPRPQEQCQKKERYGVWEE